MCLMISRGFGTRGRWNGWAIGGLGDPGVRFGERLSSGGWTWSEQSGRPLRQLPYLLESQKPNDPTGAVRATEQLWYGCPHGKL